MESNTDQRVVSMMQDHLLHMMVGGHKPRCNMTESPCVEKKVHSHTFQKVVDEIQSEQRLFSSLSATPTYNNVVVNLTKHEADFFLRNLLSSYKSSKYHIEFNESYIGMLVMILISF